MFLAVSGEGLGGPWTVGPRAPLHSRDVPIVNGLEDCLRGRGLAGRPVGLAQAVDRWGTSGSRTVKVLPCPTPLDSPRMVPP